MSGTAITGLQIAATDSGGLTLSYSATGLPTGLSINATTGLITGTPATTGSYSVKVTAQDSSGASGTAAFTWGITTSEAPTTLVLAAVPNGAIRTGSPGAYWALIKKGAAPGVVRGR